MTSGQEQVDQCSQRGADACGNQDIIGPEVAVDVTLDVKRVAWVLLRHLKSLGREEPRAL